MLRHEASCMATALRFFTPFRMTSISFVMLRHEASCMATALRFFTPFRMTSISFVMLRHEASCMATALRFFTPFRMTIFLCGMTTTHTIKTNRRRYYNRQTLTVILFHNGSVFKCINATIVAAHKIIVILNGVVGIPSQSEESLYATVRWDASCLSMTKIVTALPCVGQTLVWRVGLKPDLHALCPLAINR